MAAFVSYYDASGTQEGDGPLIVAGLVSTERDWLRFEREWQKFLDEPEFGVPYLHMKEFAHSTPGSPFQAWKGDEPKRRKFLDKAIRIIKRYVRKPFVGYVSPSVVRSVDQVYDLGDAPANLFTVIGVGCVEGINTWMKAKNPGCPILHIFEKGDTGQARFVHEFQAQVPTLTAWPAKDEVTGAWVTPFQAADLVAYEHRLAIEAQEKGERFDARASFRALRKMLPFGYFVLPKERLIELCESDPARFPPRPEGF